MLAVSWVLKQGGLGKAGKNGATAGGSGPWVWPGAHYVSHTPASCRSAPGPAISQAPGIPKRSMQLSGEIWFLGPIWFSSGKEGEGVQEWVPGHPGS